MRRYYAEHTGGIAQVLDEFSSLLGREGIFYIDGFAFLITVDIYLVGLRRHPWRGVFDARLGNAREGEFVNHPDDRGGLTNWGITQRALEAYREPMTVADEKTLTKPQA